MEYSSIVAAIPKPDGKEQKIKKYQNTDDIIKDLIFCFKEYNHQAKPIADKYGTGNVSKDGKNIYNFIKKNISYDAEPERDQTTRSFSRIIYDKWGDCKHTASIVGSIGWNEGHSVIFRVVRYLSKEGDFIYHVYTILEDKKTGQQVIVDPLQDFDYEKKYDKKIGDYKAINNMTLTRLTGTGDTFMGANENYESHQIGMIDTIGSREIVMTPMGLTDDAIGEIEHLEGIGKKKSPQKTAKKAANKEKRKKLLKKGVTLFKKVNLAPIRGAFSALLLLNFLHIASRFQKAIEMGKGNKITAFGKKFGYSDQILKSQILKGSKKKGIGAINPNEINQVDGIGVIVTSAAVVAASTAIAAALSLLKSMGLGKKGDEKAVKEAGDNMATTVSTSDSSSSNSNPNTQFSTNSGGGNDSSSVNTGGGNSENSGGRESNATTQSTEGGEAANGTSFMDKIKSLPTPVLVIGGIGIAYIAGKKFKIF